MAWNFERTWRDSGGLRGAAFRWLVLTVAVWLASAVVPGVDYADWPSLLAAALILGVLNSVLKPALVALAFPMVLLTLGFLMPAINAFLLLLTAGLVPGFRVAGFWPAVGGSLVISLTHLFLGNVGRGGRDARAPESPGAAEPTRIRRPPPGKGPIIDV
jgi:putative membrane protein